MKYIKIALGLTIVAGLMAVMAGPALAEQVRWVNCVKETGPWKNSECSEKGPPNEYKTKEITETISVASSSKGLELSDTKATGGISTIKCEGTDKGWIGANGSGGVSEITATGCTVTAGACKKGSEAKAVAIDLPWNTSLEERAGGEVRGVVTAGGKGPGYRVECKVAGIFEVEDECVGTTSTKETNNFSANTVESEFEAKSEKGNCTNGGTGSGEVKGIDVIKLVASTGAWWFLIRGR
jgi:hypothetical protein